jgi:hypothetical protein
MHHTVGTAPFILCVASLTGLFQNQVFIIPTAYLFLKMNKLRTPPCNFYSSDHFDPSESVMAGNAGGKYQNANNIVPCFYKGEAASDKYFELFSGS